MFTVTVDVRYGHRKVSYFATALWRSQERGPRGPKIGNFFSDSFTSSRSF